MLGFPNTFWKFIQSLVIMCPEIQWIHQFIQQIVKVWQLFDAKTVEPIFMSHSTWMYNIIYYIHIYKWARCVKRTNFYNISFLEYFPNKSPHLRYIDMVGRDGLIKWLSCRQKVNLRIEPHCNIKRIVFCILLIFPPLTHPIIQCKMKMRKWQFGYWHCQHNRSISCHNSDSTN